MSILIGADIVPTKANIHAFSSGNTSLIIGNELKRELESADCRIFNLETPLTDIEKPIIKSGPHLIAPSSTINGLVGIKTDIVTLANNHILDQGEEGLFSTLNLLKSARIKYVGAGCNNETAKEPLSFTFQEKTISIYACTQHEFSVSTVNRAGANLFDPLNSLDDISDLKSKSDYVIVLYHAGKEYYQYPTPELQKRCRKMVEKGANIVICQHSHCIGAKEKYNNGTIVYGQGNFLFEESAGNASTYSLLVRINNDFSIDYLPIRTANGKSELLNNTEKESVLSSFQKRSEEITDLKFVCDKFREDALQSSNYYLRLLTGNTFFSKILYKIYPDIFSKYIFSGKRKTAALNAIQCEAHNEVIVEALSCFEYQ